MKIQVFIQNKVGVFDPEGKVIETGLKNLGFDAVSSAKMGKVVTLDIETENVDEAKQKVAEMCDAFLVNPVLERYDIKVL